MNLKELRDTFRSNGSAFGDVNRARYVITNKGVMSYQGYVTERMFSSDYHRDIMLTDMHVTGSDYDPTMYSDSTFQGQLREEGIECGLFPESMDYGDQVMFTSYMTTDVFDGFYDKDVLLKTIIGDGLENPDSYWFDQASSSLKIQLYNRLSQENNEFTDAAYQAYRKVLVPDGGSAVEVFPETAQQQHEELIAKATNVYLDELIANLEPDGDRSVVHMDTIQKISDQFTIDRQAFYTDHEHAQRFDQFLTACHDNLYLEMQEPVVNRNLRNERTMTHDIQSFHGSVSADVVDTTVMSTLFTEWSNELDKLPLNQMVDESKNTIVSKKEGEYNLSNIDKLPGTVYQSRDSQKSVLDSLYDESEEDILEL